MTYYILGELYRESGNEEKGRSMWIRAMKWTRRMNWQPKKILEYRKVQDYENMNKAIDQLDSPIEDKELQISLTKQINIMYKYT